MRRSLKLLLGSVLALGLIPAAQALTITITSNDGLEGKYNATSFECTYNTGASSICYVGDENDQTTIVGIVGGIVAPATELYKNDFDDGEESGALARSYTTIWGGEESGPNSATITYDGGPFVGPIAWLLVKDGNASPNWYLFNLTDMGWNGTEQIVLENFYLGTGQDTTGGAISNVGLWGGAAEVPAPGTMALMGLGLLGLGFAARRRLS